MKAVYVFMADGFEEIEALTVVDVLRRAGLQAVTVSVGEGKTVTGAHGISVLCDVLFTGTAFDDASMLVLPGGMPGASNLYANEELRELLLRFAGEGKPLAAICAAPFILGRLGLLDGRRATCYPSFEPELRGATVTGKPVEQDGPVITGRGPGAAMAFALALVASLCGGEKAAELKKAMVVE